MHGDPHFGNLFVDVEGGDRTGFLDWAVLCRAPGLRDVAYVLCNSVPQDVREPNEREFVDRYCEVLAAAGVDLDPVAAWEQYRLFAVYSWVAAAATAGMGSKWQPLSVGLERDPTGDGRVRAPRQRRPPRVDARMSTTCRS